MSVEPLLNRVCLKLSVNLSVLTNRQKFCIRLLKWVFVKVDNRLKVTSFGDPQHQETTLIFIAIKSIIDLTPLHIVHIIIYQT